MILMNFLTLTAIALITACIRPTTIATSASTEAKPIWNGMADTAWYDSSQTIFTITTAEQLAGLAEQANSGNLFVGKTINLGTNIMLNDTANWQNWETTPPANKWTPIKVFRGIFDGNGYEISGVYINSNSNDVGLFGRLADSAEYVLDLDYWKNPPEIKNLGVVASYIKGKDRVGGLVGKNKGKINSSYFTGIVTGEEAVGGLVGHNDLKDIRNCYSTGAVYGKEHTGGLVGDNQIGDIINSYYDKETSGQNDLDKGEGKTTKEMQSQAFADNLNLVASILQMKNWVHSNGKYPVLGNQIATKAKIADFFASGDGTESKPYIIKTQEHLKKFSWLSNLGINFKGQYIKLENNIVLNDTANWIDWEVNPPANKWEPVRKFHGTFDGNGHKIIGVYINNANYNQGFFSAIYAEIKNLGIIASHIKGKSSVGSLAGASFGATDKCYSISTVIGDRDVGGLIGVQYGEGEISSISNSYSAGRVTGTWEIGGLVGSLIFIEGIIIGDHGDSSIVERIEGQRNGKISNSYSISRVTGSGKRIGGLVGLLGFGNKIENSYYDKEASGQSDEGKGLPKATVEMKQKANFSGWDFDNVWGIDNNINSGYPYLK